MPLLVIIVPVKLASLYELAQSYSAFACAARLRAPTKDWFHVVVAGNLGALDAEGYRLSGQLPLALEHVYDARRRGKGQQNTFLRLVLLQPNDPSVPVRSQLLEHPFYETRLACAVINHP